MAERGIDLSVVVVSYNTRDLTRQCLRSIYENTRSITFEVCVVDNNSSDDSAEMVGREFPQVHLIRNEVNKGLAAATNQGLATSTGRYVLALNSDTVVLPEALDKLVRFMDDHPEAGGATPKLLLPNRSPHPTFCGRAPTLKAELLCALSPLHSNFSEAADTEVIHYGGQSTKQADARMFAQLFKSKCRLVQKHYGFFAGTALRLAVAGVCSVRLAKWMAIYLLGKRARQEAVVRISRMWAVVRAVVAY